MKERPFAYIGLSMLVAFAVSFYFGAALFVAAAALVILVSSLIIKSLRENRSALIVISVSLLVSVLIFTLYSSDVGRLCSRFDGKQVSLTAKVTGVTERYSSDRIELESETVDGEAFKCRILFYYGKDSGIEYGDRVELRAVLLRCDNNYDLSRGLRYRVLSPDTDSLKITSNSDRGLGYIPVCLRSQLIRAGRELMGGYEGEFCNAVTLGDKTSMSYELYGWFQKTGLSYVVVVSGMHMSIIAMFLMLALKPLKRGRRRRIIQCILIVCGIILYAAITGFAPSAVRSAVMMIIIIIGRTIRRQSDIYNSLGIAAIVMAVFNPYAVGDIGLILSFASVFGIAFFGDRFFKRILEFFKPLTTRLYREKIKCKSGKEKFLIELKLFGFKVLILILNLFAVSIAANIAAAPITMLHFGEWHPFAVIYSVFFAPVLYLVVPFTLLAAVLYLIPFAGALAYPFVAAAKFCAFVNVGLVRIIAGTNISAFYIEPEYAAFYLTAVFVFFAIAMTRRRRRQALVIAAAFSVFAFVAGYAGLALYNSRKVTLSVYNTGDGCTVVLSGSEGVNVLSCGGRSAYSNEVVSKLRAKTKSLEMLFVPSDQSRESSYAEYLLEEFDVSRILMYYNIKTGYPLYTSADENGGFIPLNYDEDVNIKLVNGVEDKVFNRDGHTWQYITSDSVSVLAVPYGGDVNELPEEYRSPDIVLLTREPDYFRNEINYKRAIWLSDKPIPNGLADCEYVGSGIEIDMN